MKIPKWVVIVALVLCCVVVIGLGSKFGGVYYEDTNGDDDFTLQTITDKNIIKRNLEPDGLVTSVNASTLEEYYISTSFSGVEGIWAEELADGNIEITVDYLSVKSGNFKMAVVLDDKIVHEFTVNGGKQVYSAKNITGSVCLVVAGETANCEFDYSVKT